jgi:hypothetical protein
MAVLPAGSFNTSKRVYTAFKVGDVVEGGVERVTRGLWSGNVGTLTSFFTSSAQSSTQKQYYYEIFDGISTDATSEAQFSVTYGNNAGSGSLGQNEDSPSNAIYSQYQQILLPGNQRQFTFNSVASDSIYALNFNRARLKDRLDPGNFQLNLATSISGAAAINSEYGFAARNEEKVQSTFYFVRAKNGEYNFSNNPSYVTGSNGAFRQPTFANNPKTYLTTVGLYNSSQELLAVAKLSQPILKSFSNEVLVKVKLDF